VGELSCVIQVTSTIRGRALTIVNTGSNSAAVVLTELKTDMPTQVEGPNIIYGVETDPTTLAREGSSTWNLCSKKGR
jgi:hypothetical protein